MPAAAPFPLASTTSTRAARKLKSHRPSPLVLVALLPAIAVTVVASIAVVEGLQINHMNRCTSLAARSSTSFVGTSFGARHSHHRNIGLARGAFHVESTSRPFKHLLYSFQPRAQPYSTALFHNQGSINASSNSRRMGTSSQSDAREDRSTLADELATRLVQGTADEDSSNLPPLKACIAVAGGGSGAASSIASVPGASSLLLESIVTYDRRSYAEFVSRNLIDGVSGGDDWLMGLEKSMEEQVKVQRGESTLSSGAESAASSTWSEEVFHFCSTEAAMLLSKAALNRSLQFTPSFTDQCLHCIGVGCTSSLVGKLSPEGEAVNGRTGRKSRAYIALSTLSESTRVWEVELDISNDRQSRRRSRLEEEAVVSDLLLWAMIEHREGLGHGSLSNTSGDDDDGDDGMLGRILDREGDTIVEKRFDPRGAVVHVDADGERGDMSAAWGASQIIEGNANVVAVLPVSTSDGDASRQSKGQRERTCRMKALCSDGAIPFPRDVLIVPGSFNPPHQGHTGLANAAVAALRRRRANEENRSDDFSSRPYSRLSSVSSASSASSILQSLWSTVNQHAKEDYHPTVFFEMSVTNADKPPLDPSEVERRVDFFDALPSSELPNDWAVLLTNAPLFSQKTEVLDELLAKAAGGAGAGGPGVDRRMNFVLGTDTMVRIINPKYYGNSRDNMVAALVEMKEKGVHFIVGGRLEQGTKNGTTFVNGKEEVNTLPADVQEMFTLLSEDEFRLDISSTELRKRMNHR